MKGLILGTTLVLSTFAYGKSVKPITHSSCEVSSINLVNDVLSSEEVIRGVIAKGYKVNRDSETAVENHNAQTSYEDPIFKDASVDGLSIRLNIKQDDYTRQQTSSHQEYQGDNPTLGGMVMHKLGNAAGQIMESIEDGINSIRSIGHNKLVYITEGVDTEGVDIVVKESDFYSLSSISSNADEEKAVKGLLRHRLPQCIVSGK